MRLKLEYDELLLSVDFGFNLRRYTKDSDAVKLIKQINKLAKVRRCRLSLLNPR